MKNKKIGLLTSSLVLGGMFAASNALAQNNIVKADSVAKDSTKTSVVSSSTATEKSNTVVLKASKANKDVNSSSAKTSSASQSSQASVKSSSVALSQAKSSSAATLSVKTAENSSSSTTALKADQNLNLAAKTNAASSSKTAKASSTQQAQPVMLAAKQTKDVKQVKAYDHQYHIFFNDVNNTNADGTFKGVTPQYGSDNGYTVLSFEDSHNQNLRYGVEWQTSVETKASTYKIYAPKGYHFDINYTKWFDNSKAPYFHFEGQDVVVFDWQKYANAQQNPNGNKSFELFLYKDGQKPAAIPTAKGYYIHWVPSKGYSNQVSSHPYKNYTLIPVNDMHQTGKSQYKYQVWAPAGTSFDLSQGSVYGNWKYAPIHIINDHTGYVYPDNVPTKDYVGNGQATMVAWVNKDNSWKAISSQAKKASSSTANHTDNKKPANNSGKKPAANTNHNSSKKPATNNVKKPAAPKKNTASKTTVKKTSTKKAVTSKKSSTKKAVASSSAKASVKSVKAAAPVATTVKASTVSNSNAAKATTEVVTSSVKASVAQPSVEKTVATTVTPSKAQASSSNKGLPQMGETNNHSTIGGLVALAASSILGLFGLGLRKKNN